MWELTFMHAGALWLGAAAALPLIIHLLSRQKPRVVRFPTVRFIRLSQRRSRRRVRLRHLLLLLLRMGLIVLFAALIARPVLRRGAAALGPGGAEGTPAVVIALDDSLSMNYRSGDSTCFDVARNRAMELAAGMPEGVAAAVITTSQPIGKLTREPGRAGGRIAGLAPGMQSSSCWNALEAAAALLAHEGASRREVFIFTDMTPSAWPGRERRTVEMGSDVSVYVVDCGEEERPNGAVYELSQQGEPAMLGAVFAVEATILASAGPLERTVQFEFDGRAVDRRQVRLEAGEEARLTFRRLLGEPGHHWGRVGFLNPDRLPPDDARAFTLEVAPEVAVLCVEDEPASGVESPSHFLRLALNPWREEGRGIFRIRRASPAQLADLPLGPYDVVLLAGAGDMNERAWQRLGAYVRGGGGLLAFLGLRTQDAYRTAAAQEVLPAAVGPVVAAPPDSPFGLRIVEADHSVIEAVRRSGARLSQVRYRQCRQLVPSEEALELLSFGPGLPALVIGEAAGKAAVFAGSADDAWGDFAKTEPFTPFCHELALHLAGRSAAGMQSVVVGARVPIEFDASRWPTAVYVTRPGAREPERLLPGTTPGRQTYWSTDRPGYYRLGLERRDRRWRSGFAVNTVPLESRMERVPFEEVKAAIRAGSVELVSRASLEAGRIRAGGAARELTPLVALLAIGLLLAECFLANRFYGRGDGEGAAPGRADQPPGGAGAGDLWRT